MKQKKYLRLITETFLDIQNEMFNYEYGNGVQGSSITLNLKKEMFLEKIVRSQKVAEKKHFVTKAEFEKGCYTSAYNLHEYISLEAFIEINRLGDYRNNLKKNKKASSDEIKTLIERTTIEIDNFDQLTYMSDLSSLQNNLKGKLCKNDTKLILWFFEDFLFKEIEEKDNPKNEVEVKNQDYKNKTAFKAGIKLADGEAYVLRKNGASFRSIALKLHFKETDQTYFSQSIGEASISSKNIFNNLELIQRIKQHCEEENIKICPEFSKRCTEKYSNEF